MREITVDQENAGRRLDRLLSGYLDAADSGFLHKMLRKKNIVVNGKKKDGAYRVCEGDIITLFLAEDTLRTFRKKEAQGSAFDALYREAFRDLKGDAGEAPDVVYEDDAVLLLNKPQGVLSQRDRTGKAGINEWARGYLLSAGAAFPDAGFDASVANRLDRNTEGLLIVAKTLRAAQEIAALQRTHTIRKTYHAVVFGKPPAEGEVTDTVEASPERNRVRVKRRDTEEAVLSYRTVVYDQTLDAALLKIRLYEGKKHQIRAQLAAAGFPVAGDYKYGLRARNEEWKRAYGVKSHLLHSHSLTFPVIREGALCALSGKTVAVPYGKAFAAAALPLFGGKNLVYLLQCRDKSLYCGWTNDIEARLKAHNAGRGAKYTRGRTPAQPVYLAVFETKEEAMQKERCIKQLSREQKLALIG